MGTSNEALRSFQYIMRPHRKVQEVLVLSQKVLEPADEIHEEALRTLRGVLASSQFPIFLGYTTDVLKTIRMILEPFRDVMNFPWRMLGLSREALGVSHEILEPSSPTLAVICDLWKLDPFRGVLRYSVTSRVGLPIRF